MGPRWSSIRRRSSRLGNESRPVTTSWWNKTSRNSRASRRRPIRRRADKKTFPENFCDRDDGHGVICDCGSCAPERPRNGREAERAFPRAVERNGAALQFREVLAEKGPVLKAGDGRRPARWARHGHGEPGFEPELRRD